MQKLLTATALVALTATSAFAQEIKEFNIGILGGENAQDRLTSTECFRAKIETALGVPVKVFTPADYDGVIQGLLGGTIDYAWLGASAYAKTQLTDPEAVEVKLTKQNADGSTGYYSIGFTRKDTGITSMDDAKGKVFAFADPNSTSGYLVPGAELSAKYGTLDAYFSEVKMSGGHEQTIVGVANGETGLARLRFERPDVCVLDVNLGSETSLKVAEALMERRVPFIFATGYADSAIIPKALAHVPTVRKPYDAENLTAAIAKVLTAGA